MFLKKASEKFGAVQILYYRWSKEFLEAGEKRRLVGDTAGDDREVKELRVRPMRKRRWWRN